MARADRVPFLSARPLVAVRATLNELRGVRLIVDTGAERTVISRRVAELRVTFDFHSAVLILREPTTR